MTCEHENHSEEKKHALQPFLTLMTSLLVKKTDHCQLDYNRKRNLVGTFQRGKEVDGSAPQIKKDFGRK